MPMDLNEAAKALNTSREMLLRWARQGAIPAVEKNGEYFFDQRSLEAWAKRRHMPIRFETEKRSSDTDLQRVGIAQAMRRGGVYFSIRGKEVETVLLSAVDSLSLPDDIDKDELLTRLIERESLASTGIGHGVAIPHPRQPLDNVPVEGFICTCFLEEEVDFNSVDGKPVFVIFIMMSPGTKRHLEMLARLTFCLHDTAFMPNLKSCSTAEDFLRLVQQVEEKFQTHTR
jgi:nitrogen PTS system EIIA component